MSSLIQNPYQVTLTSKLVQKRFEGATTHLLLQDTLLPDYDALSLAHERVELSTHRLIRVYSSNSQLYHVVEGRFREETATLQLHPEDRLLTQRDVTLRLLLFHAFAYYYNRTPFAFSWSAERPSERLFQITGHHSRSEAEEMVRFLIPRLRQIAQKGLQIRTSPTLPYTTAIFGLYSGPWLGPHLTSTAELAVWSLRLAAHQGDRLLFSYQLFDA